MEESLTVKNHSFDWSWIIWISRQDLGRMRCCSSISTAGAHDPGLGCPSITGWLIPHPQLPCRVKHPPSEKIWTLYRIAQNEKVISAVCKQHCKLWYWHNIECTREKSPCMSCPTQQLWARCSIGLRLKLPIMFVDIVEYHSPWLILFLTKEPENVVKYEKHESTKAAWCSLGVKKTETDGSGYEELQTEMQLKHEGWTAW